jgi:hypothetical protein
MIYRYITRYLLKTMKPKPNCTDKEVSIIYENILHLICKNDNIFGLKFYNKATREFSGNFFINCPYSPMMFLKLRTGIELMKKLRD